jgi:nitrogen fixation protein FixH
MRATDHRPGGRPFTGRRMLAVMLAFFGVIIAANGVMAFFALSDFRGVIVDSGYVASQDFNRDAALLAAQRARGWSVEAEAEGARPAVTLSGPDGAPLERLTLSAVARRPADERLDAPLTLMEAAPGRYEAVERLAPGQWRLSLRAEGAGAPYVITLPLMIEP